MIKKITDKQKEIIRQEYDNLKSSGCKTATYFRVKARNLGIHPETVRRIAARRGKYKD